MAFREVLDECGLMDLGFRGEKYTWKGKRPGGMVLERLDRAVANNTWFASNPGTQVQHLQSHASDLRPIIVKPDGIFPKPCRPFKFEKMWLSNWGCSDTVICTWGNSAPDTTMAQDAGKIKLCGDRLSIWSKKSFGCIKKMLETKSKMLAKAELAAARGGGDYALVKALQLEVNALLDKESQMWEQRARALFLKCSDRNTSYFHSKASHRYRRNRISDLRNNANVWCSEVSQIKEIAVEYYNSLFTSSNPSDMNEILDAIRPSVSADMNIQLSKPFSREEVDTAIKEMDPIKAPGPDGMPPIFYHSFWSLLGDDVYNAVLDCLNNCKIPKEINHTNITLIPKVKSPESITEFRPISLCNVIYKLVSKVLANRFKSVLPFIISENQSAFQAGKVITDNVLMAFETLHYMKHHQTGKSGFMALKLDMSKAYD